MKKHWFTALFCALVLVCPQLSQAASREELAAIRVEQPGDFQYWSETSAAKAALVAYVESVTDPQSPDFIPMADRVAVFDMDGTIFDTERVYHDAWNWDEVFELGLTALLDGIAARFEPRSRPMAQE